MKKIHFSALLRHDWRRLTLELLVVFLGVTAGFILNGWRESSQEKTLEKKYLRALIHDLDGNIEDVIGTVKGDSAWSIEMNRLVGIMTAGSLTQDSAIAIFKNMSSFSRSTLFLGTYEALTHSGNINLIRDFEVKRKILAYSVKKEAVQAVDDLFMDRFDQLTLPFVINEFDLLRGQLRDSTIMHTSLFSNQVVAYQVMREIRYQTYSTFLDETRALKKAIQAYLGDH